MLKIYSLYMKKHFLKIFLFVQVYFMGYGDDSAIKGQAHNHNFKCICCFDHMHSPFSSPYSVTPFPISCLNL